MGWTYLYHAGYDPAWPVVCFDKTSQPLHRRYGPKGRLDLGGRSGMTTRTAAARATCVCAVNPKSAGDK